MHRDSPSEAVDVEALIFEAHRAIRDVHSKARLAFALTSSCFLESVTLNQHVDDVTFRCACGTAQCVELSDIVSFGSFDVEMVDCETCIRSASCRLDIPRASRIARTQPRGGVDESGVVSSAAIPASKASRASMVFTWAFMVVTSRNIKY